VTLKLALSRSRPSVLYGANFLLQLTPAQQADLTLLDKGACNGHSLYRTRSNPLFPARDYLPVHYVRRIIRNNSLVGRHDRAEV